MAITAFPPHYRRNFGAFMGDYVCFALAMTFANATTVLPDFVGRLTDSEVVVGLLTTVANGAWLLPQLLFAHLLTNKRRKKPYVTPVAILTRPLYLLYAVGLGMGLGGHPALALFLLFVVQILLYGGDALVSIAWFDVMGKAIPAIRRGRLVGTAQLISGLLSIGAGVLIAALLGADGPPFPQNYTIILALAGLSLLFSLFSWGLVVEPDEPVEEQRPAWRDYLSQLLQILRQDRALSRVTLVRLLAGFDGLALGFYILFATRELGLPPETVGLFTAAQTVGRILAALGLGTLSERAGSHRVVQVATLLSLTAPLVGLGLLLSGAQASAATVAIYAWIFVVIGVGVNARMLGFFNYVLEVAPAGQRPSYIGLFSTISGPLVLLPAVGGWLLHVTSYGVLFALTGGMLIVAHGLSWSLPSARHASTTLQTEPVT
jgi:MFS family permease